MVTKSNFMDDPVRRRIESRNISLSILNRRVSEALLELEFLINATETGERRNTFTAANIHLMFAKTELNKLKGETIK
jgi:hypothetical protein